MPSSPAAGPGQTLHQLSASPRVLRWIGAMTEALDEPLLLVDARGRLLKSNAAAERELGSRHLLVRHDGQVRAAHAGDERSFRASLAAAARTGRRRRWRGGAVLVTPVARDGASEGDPPLLLLVLRRA